MPMNLGKTPQVKLKRLPLLVSRELLGTGKAVASASTLQKTDWQMGRNWITHDDHG